MSFLDTAAAAMTTAESHIHAGALWLLGAYASAEKAITTAEASDPLVKAAADLALQEAAAHGVPVAGIETVGAQVLAAAQSVAAATAPPAAPAHSA